MAFNSIREIVDAYDAGSAGNPWAALLVDNDDTGTFGEAIQILIDALDAVPTANENADALLDRANGIESGRTPRGALRLILSALVGKLNGATTTSISVRDTSDSKNRLVVSVDGNGNRTAVTYDDT